MDQADLSDLVVELHALHLCGVGLTRRGPRQPQIALNQDLLRQIHLDTPSHKRRICARRCEWNACFLPEGQPRYPEDWLYLGPFNPPLTCHTNPAHGDVERDGNKLVIQQKIAEDLTVAIESIPNSMVTLVKHLSK